ncbi:MAG: hypothetical protein AAF619_04720 [Pseudomonadota bacterium]
MIRWVRHLALLSAYGIGAGAVIYLLLSAIAFFAYTSMRAGEIGLIRVAFMQSYGVMTDTSAAFLIPAAMTLGLFLAIRLVFEKTVSWPAIAIGIFVARIGVILLFAASAALNTTAETGISSNSFNLRNSEFWFDVILQAVLLAVAFCVTYWVLWRFRGLVGLHCAFPNDRQATT